MIRWPKPQGIGAPQTNQASFRFVFTAICPPQFRQEVLTSHAMLFKCCSPISSVYVHAGVTSLPNASWIARSCDLSGLTFSPNVIDDDRFPIENESSPKLFDPSCEGPSLLFFNASRNRSNNSVGSAARVILCNASGGRGFSVAMVIVVPVEVTTKPLMLLTKSQGCKKREKLLR